MGGKRNQSSDESSYSKRTIKVTQASVIKEKHSRYTPPTNQVWEEKEERGYDESSHAKHKKRVAQVSIIKEKHSRYIPPTNQGWEEKEEGSNEESSHSKHKIKEIHVYISKKNIQGTHHLLIRCGREKEIRAAMKAAIQNTK